MSRGQGWNQWGGEDGSGSYSVCTQLKRSDPVSSGINGIDEEVTGDASLVTAKVGQGGVPSQQGVIPGSRLDICGEEVRDMREL